MKKKKIRMYLEDCFAYAVISHEDFDDFLICRVWEEPIEDFVRRVNTFQFPYQGEIT